MRARHTRRGSTRGIVHLARSRLLRIASESTSSSALAPRTVIHNLHLGPPRRGVARDCETEHSRRDELHVGSILATKQYSRCELLRRHPS